MATNISLCSNALVLLGDRPIASFTDEGAGAESASNLYESCYNYLLSLHRWRFATKKANLSRSTTRPTNQWAYQFQLPSDFIMLVTTYPVSEFEIYGDKIYTNQDACAIDYIYRISESQLPHYFAKVCEYYLATAFAIPVTGNSTRLQEMQNLYLMHLKQAKNIDSTSRPNQGIIDSPFTDTRW